jgi:hypothetical protein
VKPGNCAPKRVAVPPAVVWMREPSESARAPSTYTRDLFATESTTSAT